MKHNSTTKFPVSLASYGEVKLFIFSVSGELIWDNTWETVPAGDYDKEYFADHGFFPFEWNGKNKNGEYVASGIYIYQIVTGNTSEVKKMVVVNER
jgi:flagellar hook assembly protein FlgD